MASGKPSLKIVYSLDAIGEIREIWRYNAQRYDGRHADLYEDFLTERIDWLMRDFEDGKPVPNRPELCQITLKRNPRGHGHIVVYRVDLEMGSVNVLHVFHTAQDWPNKLS